MTEHPEQHKKSIRSFNDHEVRAIWDEERNKRWFSVLDIIAAINEQGDLSKDEKLLEVSQNKVEESKQ